MLRTMPAPRLNNGNRDLALGRMKAGKMNKTEERYAARLEYERMDGKVKWWRFEGMKLRLADGTFYSPDFAVMAADGVIELHEVKGFWRDDAKVKVKVAAEQFPFRFKIVMARTQKAGGGFEITEV